MINTKIKTKYFYKKIIDIPISELEKYDLIFIDLDNTLTAPEKNNFSEKISNWLSKIKKEKIILSNSKNISKRKTEIEEKIKIRVFLNKNKKPWPPLYKELNQDFNLKNKKVAIIGDNIFTDILFGNLNNFDTFLIEAKYPDNWFKTFFNNLFIKILRIKK